jgi:hypothetical protein
MRRWLPLAGFAVASTLVAVLVWPGVSFMDVDYQWFATSSASHAEGGHSADCLASRERNAPLKERPRLTKADGIAVNLHQTT